MSFMDWLNIADKAVKAKPFPLKCFLASHKDEEKMIKSVQRYLKETYGFRMGYPAVEIIAYIVDDVVFQLMSKKEKKENEDVLREALDEIFYWDCLGLQDIERFALSDDFGDGFVRGRQRTLEILEKHGIIDAEKRKKWFVYEDEEECDL